MKIDYTDGGVKFSSLIKLGACDLIIACCIDF